MANKNKSKSKGNTPKKTTEVTPPIPSSQTAAGSPKVTTPDGKGGSPPSPTLSFSSRKSGDEIDSTYKTKIVKALGLSSSQKRLSVASNESEISLYDVGSQAEAEDIALANIPEEQRGIVRIIPH